MQKIKVGLLGLGTVGSGVWKILNTNRNQIIGNCGYDIEIAKILVRDINKPRSIDVPKKLLTTNADDIFNDDDIKIVIELIGGANPAKEYMLRAMKCKKHVVTANKLVIATEGEELFKTAEKEGVLFYYEASVGGGMQIIRKINEGLTANKIESIVAIINGTTNYILTKMTNEGMDFQAALKEAQLKGYAEADPSSDIEGHDAAYKLAIMATLSFGVKVDLRQIFREGITKITLDDIKYADKLGYVIKLLAIGREAHDNIELRVHPAMVPKTHPLSSVNDSFNAVFIKGNAVGDLMLYGRGAGDLPTGSAVVSDIISIIRNNVNLSPVTSKKFSSSSKRIQNIYENRTGYYIRLCVENNPDVFGKISAILGHHDINILTAAKNSDDKDKTSLIFIIEETFEGNIAKATEKIKLLDNVKEIQSIIRIENLNQTVS